MQWGTLNTHIFEHTREKPYNKSKDCKKLFLRGVVLRYVSKHTQDESHIFIHKLHQSKQSNSYIYSSYVKARGKVINNICKYFLYLISMSQTSIMSGPRTRHTSGTNLIDLIGRGIQFLTSEQPTARDILQLGIFLK